MYLELAPGIAKVSTDDWNSFSERVWQHRSLNDWGDARIYDPKKEDRVVDQSYRKAGVIGPVQQPQLIGEFEVAAKQAAWPYITKLGSYFASLRISGSQLVRYTPGDFFKPHRDSGSRYKERCFTILQYLTPCEGGETVFSELNVEIAPQVGSWLVFYSEYLHESKPIISGEKIIFVTWAVL